MKRFKSAGHSQRFLSTHSRIHNHFQLLPSSLQRQSASCGSRHRLLHMASRRRLLRQLDTSRVPFSTINIRPIGNLTTPFSSLRS